MYNEILRKITSLSLLIILLTSTAAFAMPNALPQAHASTNANLFVSAENSQFNNYFAGPQVIQVVVSDPNIQRLDQSYGEPVVTINGKKLRMAQATDGNWYAYFADRNQAIAAGNTAAVSGAGLNFGGFCSPSSATSGKSGVNYQETKGFTVARGGFGSINLANGTITSGGLPVCNNTPASGQFTAIQMEHVVRQNKTINMNTLGFGSGTTTYPQMWPVIQLYDFSGFPITVTVDYQKAGGDQISTLTFDRIPQVLVSSSVDRTAYPANSQVFVTINDPQLNIDPTEEDSWTWAANAANNQLFYMAFNRNGQPDADGNPLAMQNLVPSLTTFMFDHNGKFTLNPAAQGVNVVDFQKNGKEPLTSTDGTGRGQTSQVSTSSIGTNSSPVTFIESGGVNTGVYVNWDGGKVSDVVTTNSLTIRGQSATIRYNDVSTSIVGGFSFGTLASSPINGTWASGQKIPITLVDGDANLNSKISEHRDLFNPSIYQSGTGGIPTMTIGTPFSLGNGVTNDLVTFISNTPLFTPTISGQSTVPNLSLGSRTAFSTTSTANADAVNVEHIALATPAAGTTPVPLATLGSPSSSVLTPLALGQAANYTILSGNSAGVITNGAPNQLVSIGNVGHTSTETAPFTFGAGYSDVSSPATLGTITTPATPIGDAHSVLLNIGTWNGATNTGLRCTFTFANGAIDLAADTTHPGGIGLYPPGVYCINGAASIGTAGITLTGTGTYIFKINGALTTVSGSKVLFTGPGGTANAGNLFWAPVGGASTFGTDQFSGTILAGSAAITTGAAENNTNARFISESAITIGGGANLFKRPTIQSGAVSGIGPTFFGTSGTPVLSASTPAVSGLGTAGSYAILSGAGPSTGVITNGAPGQLISRGNVGHLSTETPNNSFTFASGFSDVSSPAILGTIATPGTPIGDAHSVLSQIGTYIGGVNTGLACTFTFSGAINLLTDVTHGTVLKWAPGVYCIDGAITDTGAGTLNFTGTGSYIFKSNGAFTTAAGNLLIFSGPGQNHANAGNLIFAPIGGATLGANNQFAGTILAGSAQITTGAVCNCTDARLVSESAITIGGGANSFAAPTVTSGPGSTGALFGAAATTNGGVIIDSTKKVSDLLNTIHSNLATSTDKFRGFNFINYDLRSLGKSTTTGNLGNVNVYLITNPAGTGILQANGQVVGNGTGFTVTSIANSTNLQDFINLNNTQVTTNLFNLPKTASVGLFFKFSGSATLDPTIKPIAVDFFSVGIKSDGITNDQRVNNAIYRWELQETGPNTSTFTGTTEYVMLNQLNIFDPNTYSTLRTINHEVKFVAIQDMLAANSRAPQATYEDLGADGQFTLISAQTDVPTHTGVVSFDSKTYKIADTVTITLNDADLNVDNNLVDIYTTVTSPFLAGSLTQKAHSIAAFGVDPAADTAGKPGLGLYSDGKTAFGRLLDIQFGQSNSRWSNTGCFGAATSTPQAFNLGLFDTGFSLVETGPSTGIFTGTFEIPDQICDNSNPGTALLPNNSTAISAVGLNIKVNYVDFRASSGKKIEISDNAGIRGNTGSITLDKSVYPVPFGSVMTSATTFNDFAAPASSVTSLKGVFPLHRDNTGNGLTSSNTLSNGDTLVHIRVNDQDYNLSPAGTDHIAVAIARAGDNSATGHGPVWATVSRQGATSLLAFAGGPAAITAHAVIKTAPASATAPTGADANNARELGPMTEIDPASGIFQADLPIRFTDGPASNDCPTPSHYQGANGTYNALALQTDRFDLNAPAGTHYCLRQGDVLTVYYNDTNDASGHQQTVTDSATFDLRNGVLQSDKSVYIIGSDMILTLVEPDLNLDSQQAETASLDLIEWDSHAFKGTMGPLGLNTANFDAKPSSFAETGKDTGIFQAVIKIPKQLSTTGSAKGTLLERGEQIHLEYTDWGPAGSKTVGTNNQDIQLTIYTSNFGATVELDQKVYTWTDRVYITIVAPDHNFDPNLIDTIGDNDLNKVTVSTRGNSISPYKLVESGVDTGIFTGYVILTGSKTLKDVGGVDGQGTQPTAAGPSGIGPTDGFLPAEDNDGVSVSFEFTRDQTVTGSALIRWNIGEVKWLQASYPANGQGVLQIVDPDMNLNPKAIDKFDTNVWSDSDSGGIKLTMTETGQATGIFQGTVYFTTNFQSSGNRLHVAEGDTVTGEYKDRTLPAPYTPADQLRLTSTTFIGTVVPPLERAPASNPRIVDSFGNALTSVKVNQQIQVTADLTNGQDRAQPFAYLVQIQDANGVTVSLSWITGTLTGGQSLNPAQSWTPTASGTYTAQIFVWQSIDNPNALSPPLSTKITVA